MLRKLFKKGVLSKFLFFFIFLFFYFFIFLFFYFFIFYENIESYLLEKENHLVGSLQYLQA